MEVQLVLIDIDLELSGSPSSAMGQRSGVKVDLGKFCLVIVPKYFVFLSVVLWRSGVALLGLPRPLFRLFYWVINMKLEAHLNQIKRKSSCRAIDGVHFLRLMDLREERSP